MSFSAGADSQQSVSDPQTSVQDDIQNSGQLWLTNMSQALRSLNYHISFVVLNPNNEFEPYRWRHGVTADGTEVEHLSLQNGPGREVVRIGDKVSYFEPNIPAFSLQSDVINGPIPAEFFRDFDIFSKGYDVMLVGRSRVSGRPAQQLRIVSRDKSRYGYNLWLDQQTALLLKLDMLDFQGQVVEQVQVTSLEVTEGLDEYFSRIERAKLPDVVQSTFGAQGNDNWQIGWMPEGMQEVKRDIHRLPLTRDVIDYAMLSDGLVDVSVYLQKITQPSQNNGWLRHGSDTLLSIQQDGIEITVVGKVPPQTASAIAKSISYSVSGQP